MAIAASLGHLLCPPTHLTARCAVRHRHAPHHGSNRFPSIARSPSSPGSTTTPAGHGGRAPPCGTVMVPDTMRIYLDPERRDTAAWRCRCRSRRCEIYQPLASLLAVPAARRVVQAHRPRLHLGTDTGLGVTRYAHCTATARLAPGRGDIDMGPSSKPARPLRARSATKGASRGRTGRRRYWPPRRGRRARRSAVQLGVLGGSCRRGRARRRRLSARCRCRASRTKVRLHGHRDHLGVGQVPRGRAAEQALLALGKCGRGRRDAGRGVALAPRQAAAAYRRHARTWRRPRAARASEAARPGARHFPALPGRPRW